MLTSADQTRKEYTPAFAVSEVLALLWTKGQHWNVGHGKYRSHRGNIIIRGDCRDWYTGQYESILGLCSTLLAGKNYRQDTDNRRHDYRLDSSKLKYIGAVLCVSLTSVHWAGSILVLAVNFLPVYRLFSITVLAPCCIFLAEWVINTLAMAGPHQPGRGHDGWRRGTVTCTV